MFGQSAPDLIGIDYFDIAKQVGAAHDAAFGLRKQVVEPLASLG